MLIVADKPAVANAVLGPMRLDLAERFDLIDPAAEAVLLGDRVADVRVERGRGPVGPAAPSVHGASTASSTPTPGAARALAYDVVWNGKELGGGSIRISDAERAGAGARGARDLAGGGRATASASCSRRCVTARRRTAGSPTASTGSARCSAADSIRDVIAFPKAASGGDPLTGAPAPVDERQLRELGLELRAKRPS